MGNETINAWVLPSEAIEWVNKNIPENSIILELGSGFGTKLLSEWFNMVSIEHNQEWLNKYKSKYIYAPLKNGFYDRDIIKGKLTDEYSLFIIDGPPEATGGRLGLLKNLDLFNLNCYILIDDINRDDDYKLFEELIKILNREYEIFENKEFGKKFGIIKPK